MASSESFARRFIAGETIDEAIDAARRIQSRGFLLTLDYLGESVRTSEEATAATTEYLRLIDVIVASGIERNLSLKLTQLGIDVDRATCVDNLRRILDPAERHGFFVRIDMENSPYTAVTLEVFETLWQQGHRWRGRRAAGVPVPDRERRPAHERARRPGPAGEGRVQGAGHGGVSAEERRRRGVRAADARCSSDEGTYPAIATHDEAMIRETCAYAGHRGIGRDTYEFQMLYGIRRDLQSSLRREGPPDADLRAVRPAMVSVFHAPARRTAGERRVRGAQPAERRSDRVLVGRVSRADPPVARRMLGVATRRRLSSTATAGWNPSSQRRARVLTTRANSTRRISRIFVVRFSTSEKIRSHFRQQFCESVQIPGHQRCDPVRGHRIVPCLPTAAISHDFTITYNSVLATWHRS